MIAAVGVVGLTSFFIINDKLFNQEGAPDENGLLNVSTEGLVDETENLQSAIDDTPEGGTLRVPPGEYMLSKNPDLTAVTAYGESHFALKVSKPMTIIMDDVVFVTSANDKYGVFWVYDTSDVHLQGGSLIGDEFPDNGTFISSIAVLLQDTQNSSVDGMYMKNHSQGVHLHHSNNNTVRNVTTEFNFGSGIINFASNFNLIESCDVRNSGDGHLSLYGVGENNRIVGCTVTEDREGYDYEQGITVESEYYSTIENNTISGFYYGIDIKNDAQGNVIDSNRTFNNKYNIAIRPGDDGENLMTSSSDIQITNNIAVDPREGSSYGIYIGIGEGHEITGNTLNEGHLVISDEEMEMEFMDQNTFVEGAGH
ncbi:MAG TPA: right-handed parallel beta-helix repeat-containing protein [Planococcus sp. (in: firmicutes)]|nr:right-handed parallel beta-helix repeat-containing protein [Planococcus sp. (in: firmicutes)]